MTHQAIEGVSGQAIAEAQPKFSGLTATNGRLTSRILNSEADYEAFAHAFEALSGNAVHVSYLRQSQPRGFFLNNELVAGYVLNTRAPFRYASWIPEGPRAEIAGRGYLVESTSAELTCIWICKGKLTKLQKNTIYIRSAIDAFRSGRQFIFGGSRIDKVARIQKRGLPRSIYAGNGIFDGPCEIYYAPRYSMILHLIAAALVTYSQDLVRIASRHLTRRKEPNRG